MLLEQLWKKGFSPIKVDNLQKLLLNYPEREVAQELSEGFLYGFDIKYNGPRMHVMSKNMTSALELREATFEKLMKEVSLGRMLGPFSKLPISNLQISPIGLVPKSDGNWRLITNLSHPHGGGINAFIDDEFSKVIYTSFDTILEKIYDLGKGALLGKVDIKSAFRLMPINPKDFDLLGICFEGQYFVDKCLPQGCRSSCCLFDKFSSFFRVGN